MDDASDLAWSPTRGALVKALIAARRAIGNTVGKDSNNPHFKARYASLGATLDVADRLLEHGILPMQRNESHGADGVCVVTELVHESGEWVLSRLFVPAAKHDAQGFGSAITYARRYGLQVVCSLAADDDDGNAASRPTPMASVAKFAAAAAAEHARIDGSTVAAVELTIAAMLNSATDIGHVTAADQAAIKAKADKSLSGAAVNRLRDARAKAVARLVAASRTEGAAE